MGHSIFSLFGSKALWKCKNILKILFLRSSKSTFNFQSFSQFPINFFTSLTISQTTPFILDHLMLLSQLCIDTCRKCEQVFPVTSWLPCPPLLNIPDCTSPNLSWMVSIFSNFGYNKFTLI